MLLYHGSPKLFDAFDLSTAGEGSGLKFGYGVYLSEVITNAAHYSQPHSLEAEAPNHYLYTVEIPDLTEDNHITFTVPVATSIVERVEQELGVKAPEKVIVDGKEFRKWIAMTLLGTKKNTFAGEKAAAELLNRLGVLYIIWPYTWTKPYKMTQFAVFDASNARIVKVERITIAKKGCKTIITSRQDV